MENKAREKAKRKYIQMEKGAAMRGIEFDVAFTEYLSGYFEKPCYYCGIKAIGLDRVCSAGEYEIGNVVPCCGTCNMMKGTLERDAFLVHCARIAINHRVQSGLNVIIRPIPPKQLRGSLNQRLDTEHKAIILDALNRVGGNEVRAALYLEIPRTTLRNHIKKLEISHCNTDCKSENP